MPSLVQISLMGHREGMGLCSGVWENVGKVVSAVKIGKSNAKDTKFHWSLYLVKDEGSLKSSGYEQYLVMIST